MKHLAKVHSNLAIPWVDRFSATYGWGLQWDLSDPNPLDSVVWKDLSAALDLFRHLTRVAIGNGLSTAFWFDLWIGETTLAERFPSLFSHSLRPNISVAAAITSLPSLVTF